MVALGRGCRGAPRRVTGSVCQEPALPSASVVSVEKRSFPARILPCHQPDGPSPKGRVRRVRAVLSCAASRSLSGVPDASRRGTALPLTRGSPKRVLPGQPSALRNRERRRCQPQASVLFRPSVPSGSERRGRAGAAALGLPCPPRCCQSREQPLVVAPGGLAWPGGPRGGCRLPGGARRLGCPGPWLSRFRRRRPVARSLAPAWPCPRGGLCPVLLF